MTVRLGDVLRLRKEVVHPHDKPTGQATFVGLEHLEVGTGRRTGSLQLDLSHLMGRKPRFHEGDIVYGYLRPYLNKVWVAEFDGLCSVDQYVYEVDRSVAEPDFVAWFMRSPTYLAKAPVAAGPGQLPRIRLEEVAAVEVDLPDLDRQRSIVSSLREQMAVMERARAAAETQLNAAQALSVAYIRSAFEESKTRHWPIRRLADVCTLLPSKSIARDGEMVVQAITTACLTESGFRPEGVKPARMRAASAAESVVRSGEVLVARSNTSELVGRASLFEGNPQGVVASDLTIRVGPGTRMHPPFLAAFLSFLYVTGHWREKAGGASGSMKKITRSQLADQAIPVPQIDDQERASEALSGVLLFVRRVQQTVEAQLQAIGATNQVLLRRVFGGP